MQNIAINLIESSGNVRDKLTAIDELAASMKQVGLLQPIRVRQNGKGYKVTAGHRRLEAARVLGWKEIPAIIEEEGGNVTQRQLVENCQRENLEWPEFGRALLKLQQETGWTGKEVADAIGKSEGTVSKHFAIQTLGAQTLARLEARKVAFSTAYAIVTAGHDTQENLIDAALAGAGRDAIIGKARRPREKAAKTTSRVRCPLTTGYTVTVEGDSLDTDTLIEALEGVLGQARKARTQGVEVTTLGRMFRDMAKG